MAEGSNVICRFFATTGCREGDKCMFSHDRSNTVHDSVCRFFLTGKCVYGLQCRYNHVKPASLVSSSSRNAKDSRNAKSVASQSKSDAPNTSRIAKSRQMMNPPPAAIDPNWVNAPEFVPKVRKSYADTLKPEGSLQNKVNMEVCLCPYYIVGECPYRDRCKYVHGEQCDICGKACLLPFDKEQQKQHRELCEKELEENMELSFAIQRSIDKTCGICMDVIMEKEGLSERRFGILEKCNHVFCLSCIRKWRQVKRNENRSPDVLDPVMTRACPECRVPSDFITPSQFWVDNEEQKKKLIAEYKEAMGKKPCRYFNQGRGTCPFQGACFYLHAYPDGKVADLPPPQPRRRQNQNGILDFVDQVYLWDFMQMRGNEIFSADSELSDYELSDDSETSDQLSIFT